MNGFNVGDRVIDLDAGLAALRAIMPGMPPNNTGVIEELTPDEAIVLYDDGTCSPCPYRQLRKADA